MAAYTIYLLISIAAVIVAAMSVIKNIYFRRTGLLLFGKNYKPGTTEYKRLKKIFSNRNLVINSVLLVIFIANLAYVTFAIVRLPYRGFVYTVFALALLFVIGFIIALTRARKIKQRVEGRKGRGPWLS